MDPDPIGSGSTRRALVAIGTTVCNADILKTRLGPKKRNSPSVRELI